MMCVVCSGGCQCSFRFGTGFKLPLKRKGCDLPYQCDVCLQEFYGGVLANLHRKMHFAGVQDGDNDFVCGVCEKNEVPAPIQFNCEACTLHFPTKDLFLEHFHTAHYDFSLAGVVNKNKCMACGKVLGCLDALKQHLQRHMREKKLVCNGCGERFVLVRDLRTHLLGHLGGKRHKCDECGRGFAQAAHLKIHIRTHTGEKPFECNECGKAFATSSNVNRHTRSCQG